MEHDDLIARVRSLREQGSTPKGVAKALGITRAQADALVRQVAREAAPAEAAVVGCWVNAGWSKGLSWTGHEEWRDVADRGEIERGPDDDLPELLTVVVVREHRYGRLAACSVLVDAQCLGVKNALGPQTFERHELDAILARQFSAYDRPPIRIPLDLARELVFGAEAYARGLGFSPHPDFERCRAHLGAWQGPGAITFGFDGKPMFIPGPDDDPEDVEAALERAVGADGMHRIDAGRDAEGGESYREALELAIRGDASGIPALVEALDDEASDYDAIVRGLVRLGERAIEPLLDKLGRTEPKRRYLIGDALVALGIRDERIVEGLVASLEGDGIIAEVLASYGDPGPAAIAAIQRALGDRLDRLARDGEDRDAFDGATEIANALLHLGGMSQPLAERVERELMTSRFLKQDLARYVPPGRNEPCWCGSGQKYKKCHSESDARQRARATAR